MSIDRSDYSDFVYHWTKNNEDYDAYETLLRICLESKIYGSSSNIKSGDSCVCFTETPDRIFHEGRECTLKPYGIRLTKKWLFSNGGRPVIYQPQYDFYRLDESIRWKHVNFSLEENEYRRNYTWQREWRIKRYELYLPLDSVIVVPSKKCRNKLIDDLNYYEENPCEDFCFYSKNSNKLKSQYFNIISLDRTK